MRKENKYSEKFSADWSGTEVALKQLKIESAQAFKSEAALLRLALISQQNLMQFRSKLNHPNILRLFGTWMSDRGEYFLVTEFCRHGSLDDYLYMKMGKLEVMNQLQM